jgi:hypothetical protein
MFEENIKIVNEIIEEENKEQEKNREQQEGSTPKFDTSSISRSMSDMTSKMPKF